MGAALTRGVYWGASNSSDLYIASRSTAGKFKTSLHPTVTTFGFSTEGAIREGHPAKDRTFSRLQGHPDRIPGWTVPLMVVFPVEHLQILDPKEKAGTIVVPTSESHDGMIVEVWVEEIKAQPFTMETLHVASMNLRDGRRIHVLAHHVELPWNPTVEFQQSIADAQEAARTKGLPSAGPLRFAVFGEDPDTKTQIHVELNAALGSDAD